MGLDAFGTFRYKNNKASSANLLGLYEDISELIVSFNVTHIIREGYAYNYKNKATTKLIELGGVIVLISQQYSLPIIDVAPATVKKIITGRGDSDKQGVIDVVSKVSKKEIEDDNQGDALAIWMIGHVYERITRKLYGNVDVKDISKEIKEEIDGLWRLWEK